MIYDPSAVIECLNYESKQAYFNAFGFTSSSSYYQPLSGYSFLPQPTPVQTNLNWFGLGGYAKILCWYRYILIFIVFVSNYLMILIRQD